MMCEEPTNQRFCVDVTTNLTQKQKPGLTWRHFEVGLEHQGVRRKGVAPQVWLSESRQIRAIGKLSGSSTVAQQAPVSVKTKLPSISIQFLLALSGGSCFFFFFFSSLISELLPPNKSHPVPIKLHNWTAVFFFFPNNQVQFLIWDKLLLHKCWFLHFCRLHALRPGVLLQVPPSNDQPKAALLREEEGTACVWWESEREKQICTDVTMSDKSCHFLYSRPFHDHFLSLDTRFKPAFSCCAKDLMEAAVTSLLRQCVSEARRRRGTAAAFVEKLDVTEKKKEDRVLRNSASLADVSFEWLISWVFTFGRNAAIKEQLNPLAGRQR